MSATRAEVFDLEERDRVVVASLDSEQSSVSVRVGDETVVLPENANRAVRSLLRDLATGVPVHVIPADAECWRVKCSPTASIEHPSSPLWGS
jgi:hypothetical protein